MFPPKGWDCEDVLAVYNTRFARYFMELLLGQSDSAVGVSAARNYVAEAVGGIPWPEKPLSATLRNDVTQLTALFRGLDIDETCCDFSLPRLLLSPADTLEASAAEGWRRRCLQLRSIAAIAERVDGGVLTAYRLEPQDEKLISVEEGPHPAHYPKRILSDDELAPLYQSNIESVVDFAQEKAGSKRFIAKKAFLIDRTVDIACHVLRAHPDSVIEGFERSSDLKSRFLTDSAAELLSYSVGVCFGRWDLRKATLRRFPNVTDSFANLPVCSPAELLGDDHLPIKSIPPDYPVRIAWDGILADDPEHEDDIEQRVHGVLEHIWKNRADAIEREACDILQVRDFRDYFRKPSKGGFWADHISRYSKSRRNAPIYWLLQSSHRSYGLWLYYHRLDKDLLFKALVNYVEPKIRLETNHLETLRSRKATAGDSGKEAKKLAKEMERQEDYLFEVRDFEDKLRRVANLHLEPNLNDGVVLNIAPLHELVPWKEAEGYWEGLLKGEHEWSFIGKQLRQKGLVK